MSTLPALTWAVGTRVMNSNRPEKNVRKLANSILLGTLWWRGRSQYLAQQPGLRAGRYSPSEQKSGKKPLVSGFLRVGFAGSWQESGQGRARTADTGLFRAVLYQLSYLT